LFPVAVVGLLLRLRYTFAFVRLRVRLLLPLFVSLRYRFGSAVVALPFVAPLDCCVCYRGLRLPLRLPRLRFVLPVGFRSTFVFGLRVYGSRLRLHGYARFWTLTFTFTVYISTTPTRFVYPLLVTLVWLLGYIVLCVAFSRSALRLRAFRIGCAYVDSLRLALIRLRAVRVGLLPVTSRLVALYLPLVWICVSFPLRCRYPLFILTVTHLPLRLLRVCGCLNSFIPGSGYATGLSLTLVGLPSPTPRLVTVVVVGFVVTLRSRPRCSRGLRFPFVVLVRLLRLRLRCLRLIYDFTFASVAFLDCVCVGLRFTFPARSILRLRLRLHVTFAVTVVSFPTFILHCSHTFVALPFTRSLHVSPFPGWFALLLDAARLRSFVTRSPFTVAVVTRRSRLRSFGFRVWLHLYIRSHSPLRCCCLPFRSLLYGLRLRLRFLPFTVPTFVILGLVFAFAGLRWLLRLHPFARSTHYHVAFPFRLRLHFAFTLYPHHVWFVRFTTF